MNDTSMRQLEIFTIRSPCKGICESNRKGYCKGCFRSRDERLHWLSMTDAQKHHVLYLCALRQRKLQLLAWQAISDHNQHETETTQTLQTAFDF
ncbi:DUF1289 domain-containing protein [Neisseriaceae bacterium ESL0693]|nr:DUF1289 domain-containing protein [Neisseriaceae bacterium ESL0693]